MASPNSGPSSSAVRTAAGLMATLIPVVGYATDFVGYRMTVPPADRPASVAGIPPGEACRGVEPLAVMPPMLADVRASLVRRARAGGPGRVANGVVRGSVGAAVRWPTVASSTARSAWSVATTALGAVVCAQVRVGQAEDLRLRLDQMALPPSAQIWAVSDAGGGTSLVRGPFAARPGDGADFWLPAMPGPEVVVEVHLSDADRTQDVVHSVRLAEVAELVERSIQGSDWEACSIDATCISTASVPAMENYREAVARILFVENGTTYGCSATLLADEGQTGTPYLLTANHCFDSQAAATSLTAYFDFRTDTCNGVEPNLFDMPQVQGSTLLATAKENDFTLVLLSGLPFGDVHFMGWTAQRPMAGEILHSVTHPSGSPQRYASSTYLEHGDINVCSAYDSIRDRFHVSVRLDGSTHFGSSGGSMIVDRLGGQVVGQILGVCHATPDSLDWCDGGTFDNLVGSFEYTHPLVSFWLGADTSSLVFSDDFESGTFGRWSASVP
jgi:lysyl endopeptidase